MKFIQLVPTNQNLSIHSLPNNLIVQPISRNMDSSIFFFIKIKGLVYKNVALPKDSFTESFKTSTKGCAPTTLTSEPIIEDWSVVPHPSYSPDLALYYFLFPIMKKNLKGKRLDNV